MVFACALDFITFMLTQNTAAAPPVKKQILLYDGEDHSAFRQALARTRQTAALVRTIDQITLKIRPVSICEFEKELEASGLKSCASANRVLKVLSGDIAEQIHFIHPKPIGDLNYVRTRA